ncbi:hypothetical protein DAD186_07460 [Dermabacter vaginalis]|uniref:Uncharacterized protein n=2 Tax=Dermabacter vaginalis TaxID=1630135 RepID=A0A1B0ZH83_9MICO|nr:hypothetical protein DAD186_07460 [Dermabacter vaginalis]
MDMNAHADSMRLPGIGTVVRLDVSRMLPMTGMATLAGIAVALAFSGLGALVAPLKPVAFVGVWMAAGLLVAATGLVLAGYFYVSMVGREAPVTRTWPVGGLALLAGKLVSGVLALSVSVVGTLVMVVLSFAFLAPKGALALDDLLTAVGQLFREHPVVLTCGLMWIVLGVVSFLVYVYFAVLVGSKGFLGRLGVAGPAIVAVFMWAVVSQLVGVVSILIPLSFNVDSWSIETVSILGSIINAVKTDAEVPLLPIALPVLQSLVTLALLVWCAWDCSKVRDIQ